MRSDRQTDRQTDTLIAILRTPIGSEVIRKVNYKRLFTPVMAVNLYQSSGHYSAMLNVRFEQWFLMDSLLLLEQ